MGKVTGGGGNLCLDFIAAEGGPIFIPTMPKHLTCPCQCLLVMSLPLFQTTFLAIPAKPKHFSSHSLHALTLFLTFPLRHNSFLAIHATPKHFSWHSRYANTLFLTSPVHLNTFLALPATPKQFSCHTPYVNILYLVTPGHTLQRLVTTWQHLITTWQHLVTTWQHLVTPCNPLSPVTSKFHFFHYITKRCK